MAEQRRNSLLRELPIEIDFAYDYLDEYVRAYEAEGDGIKRIGLREDLRQIRGGIGSLEREYEAVRENDSDRWVKIAPRNWEFRQGLQEEMIIRARRKREEDERRRYEAEQEERVEWERRLEQERWEENERRRYEAEQEERVELENRARRERDGRERLRREALEKERVESENQRQQIWERERVRQEILESEC